MFCNANQIRSVVAGVLFTTMVAMPVLADDSEIYQSQAVAAGARPNVLFIIDTSGSMNSDVPSAIPAYDPSVTYKDSGCSTSEIYYSVGDAAPPTCGTNQHFPKSIFKCNAATAALITTGGSGWWPGFGNSAAKAAQYRYSKQTKDSRWRAIQNDDDSDSIECQADSGVHGDSAGDSAKFIAQQAQGGPWVDTDISLWDSLTTTYSFYNANYLNYRKYPGAAPLQRLEVVRDVAISLANSLQNVNLGLMRYNTNGQGGYMLQPVADIATGRANVIQSLQEFKRDGGEGYTPLSETFYEASLYFQGLNRMYGGKSIASSLSGETYKSPITTSCQKNYIVYLTDGAPTQDIDANEEIPLMTTGKKGSSCSSTPDSIHDGGWVEGSGICMDELADWMSDEEHFDMKTGIAGNQNVHTYMIGFGDDLAGNENYLNSIAKAGRTDTQTAYTATDVPSLTAALQSIFADLQTKNGTFVTPSISVNAFNRAQTDTDLFFSLFKVNKRPHWEGNLKKYRLFNNKIVGVSDTIDAVGATGFFSPDVTSLWSAAKDGDDVTAGGAASKLLAPDSRKLYTSIAGSDLTSGDNAVTTTNMTDARVGTGAGTTCSAACAEAVNWARGYDIDDIDGDGSKLDQVKFMGDPMHGRPAVVSYGKTSGSPAENDTVVFMPTNDGFLHAISGPTAGGGGELWAFIPPELLPRLGTLRSKATGAHTYGLDGDVRVLKMDKNQNGVIDGDDYVYLFFGMRSGGNHYYALDVTDSTKPKLLWNIGPSQLPGVGQTWSPPVVTRVNVASGNTDAEKFVLIFGGGYDTAQEAQPYISDPTGNRIYMVEAKTGTLLWSAGGPGSTPAPDLVFDTAGKEMNNSIPGRITVIDTNGDGFADRLYAGDMGGRVWRFDIFNGEGRGKLVTGGILAKLGAGGVSGATAADNRRFYNAPDVALVQFRGIDPYYNIAIGSGYRGHPLNTVTTERFYSVRDKAPYAQLSQSDYNTITPVLDGDLVDITASPTSATVTATDKGWKLTMSKHGAGEKVLAESTTVNNVILFTSFEPDILYGSSGDCFPKTLNRAYAVTAFAGKPALDFDDDKDVDDDDLSTNLKQQGIVGDVNVALIRNSGTDPNSPTMPPTICLAGTEVLKKCVNVGGTVRTFWNRVDAP
jgi:type IV pilus assembly protein PilY1